MYLDLQALGKRIRYLRKKRGLSQVVLSEMIDKEPTYISYIESGNRTMSIKTLIDISNALNTSPDDLLKDSLEYQIMRNNTTFANIISDCDTFEQQVILDAAAAIKTSMRENQKNR